MKILHAIHDFLPRHQAGSEIYALNLCRAQRALGLAASVLCTDDDGALRHGDVRRRAYDGVPITELINNWRYPSFRDSYKSPLLNRQLRSILSAERPAVLHIHNLLNLSFDLPSIARELGIPTVATLHDYTLVCASGGQRVHQAESHICTLIDPRRCSRCLTQHNFYERAVFGPMALADDRRSAPRLLHVLNRHAQRPNDKASYVTPELMEERLADVQRVFESTDLFIAPSPNLATEYRRLGLPPEKLRVSDYGFIRFTPAVRVASPERLRIGFVGTLVWHKGAHVLLDAVRALPADRIDVQIYGDTSTFPDYVARLRQQARGLPVRFLGRFERDSVPTVYASFDVLVVPSLWPENSPLVIHEAFMAQMPVVGSLHGGTQDLVTHGVNGLLYDGSSPNALAGALRSFLEDPALAGRLASAVPPVKSIDEDARTLADIYTDLVRRNMRRARGEHVEARRRARPSTGSGRAS